LRLVEDAIKAGCVAVKIYPPNGFQPWGNPHAPSERGAPSGDDINKALQKLWLKCQDVGVPVIAHAGPSMGKDSAHDNLAGPDGWRALLEANFWTGAQAPGASLGHFGGDSDDGGNVWTRKFADLMGMPRGQRIYADLAYWDQLQCSTVGTD